VILQPFQEPSHSKVNKTSSERGELAGNYNFFNFLFLALCLSLADDTWISSREETVQPRHLVRTCLCCVLHLTTYLTLGWLISQALNLTITPQLTLDSSLAFSAADFDWFLSYAVPTGLLLGGISLAWAGIMSLHRALQEQARVLSVLVTLLHLLLAVAMFGLSLPSYSGQLDRATYDRLPRELKVADRALGPLQLTHSYGLFRRMTGVGGRPEVVLEGALDPMGPWTEYDFRYKPGNTSVAPTFMLPHQPRLDWQMWFAALGTYQHNPWLVSLAYRLLEGRKEVLALLSPSSPWQQAPPAYIRARKFVYTFTEDLGSSHWWQRKEEGEYLPVLAKDQASLQEYLTREGILGLGQEPGLQHSPIILPLLAGLRRLSDATPHHIQIWSYAWLALPLLKPFVIT